MKVLQISVHDHGGCGYALAEAINATTDHKSTSVRQAPGSYIRYDAHLIASAPEDWIGLWHWADVVHIHDICPKIPRNLPPKPLVITYHGSMYRRGPKVYNDLVRQWGMVGTVATIDLMEHGLRWMPDTRPDLSSYIERAAQFVVAHAPTSRLVKDTDAIFDILGDQPGIELDIIEHVSNKECLRRKGRASLYVDQFKLCYGLNAIEAWLLGMPVIANAGKATLKRIERVMGYIPFMQIEPNADLLRAVLQLKEDGQVYREILDWGEYCAQRFHTQEAAAKIALEYYEEAMAMKPLRLPPIPSRKALVDLPPSPKRRGGLPGQGGMVVIKYVGGNDGSMAYFGEITGTKYTFSAKDPVKYIDARDLEGFLRPRIIRHKGRRIGRAEFEEAE